jgi:flagellar motor component MotA
MFLLLANFTLSEIRNSFIIGFKQGDSDYVELKNGLLFFTALQHYFILSGLLGVFIGIIAVLANLTVPEVTGSGLALSLITVLYSIVFSMGIAMPFKTGLQKRLNVIVK